MDSCYRELTNYSQRLFGNEVQNNHLFSRAEGGGGTESSSFESFRWKKRPFTVPWQPFLFFQCKNWAEAVAFIYYYLADHVFPLLEEESKEDQISF